MNDILYKGFKIIESYWYSNGTSDFRYYKISDTEISGVSFRVTLAEVKKEIDFKIDDE